MFVPFIAVEGPIGVGKTTLTAAIAETFSYNQLREISGENPFLDQFYQDKEKWSFQTEMFFLCNRYEQLKQINREYISRGLPVVADYHVFKNMLFAQRTLEPKDFVKYKEIYHILTKDLPMPNVIISLSASIPTLLNRIDERGRSYEADMDPNYLLQLSEDYRAYLPEFEATHPDIQVIHINGDEVDYVRNKEDMDAILNKVYEAVQKGLKLNEIT
ncbi:MULTISPECIES: deoxynucleoside kinase [unclassified Sporosarcina]|uniref:deoxynucleoside kinase n=1 Tax=unclassified Sporosarcina TaxID=2647733 RepID=UPI000C16DBFB|nr:MULTISPECIES: deoxynucleoside kinase [unclassified Sporosarcina]PIC97957.1 deoxynucleoside kinase [Sporosarcina sp. P29]PID04404.1 deoxynucleoside kinase [Sporosarcina sp. P30]PID07547.1 deoxynucleoside kinase [Sporosarcina sp. P31]PID10754.1 deoxynucleoside kinase [Sporosarcina sp. P32b]